MATRSLTDSTWLGELAISPDCASRQFAAGHPDTPAGFLRRLALDRDPRVIAAVKLNPSRPVPLEMRRLDPSVIAHLSAIDAGRVIDDIDFDAPCRRCGTRAVVLDPQGFACLRCQLELDSAWLRGSGAQDASPGSPLAPLSWRGPSGRWHAAHPGQTLAGIIASLGESEPAASGRYVTVDAAR